MIESSRCESWLIQLGLSLPALKAEDYVDGENPLGVALSALMKSSAELKPQLW